MTDKLSLFNGALRLLGERRLASLSENREPRRHLDQAWADGAMRYCLEAGQWRFAMRAQELAFTPEVTPAFPEGAHAFKIPDDHCRLGGVYSDGTMGLPFADYREEAGYWIAGVETMYVRYVSADVDYGADMSRWPQRFVAYVEAHLAFVVALAVTGDEKKRDDMLALRDKKCLPDALAMDAMQEPTKRMQPGSWVRARTGGTSHGMRVR